MIVPMKKVSLVVMEKSREESLKKLRELGVVHLERKSVSSDTLSKLLDRKAKIESAFNILRPYEAKKKKSDQAPDQSNDSLSQNRRASDFVSPEDVPFSTEAVNGPENRDLVSIVLEQAEERKAYQDKATALNKEKSRIEAWGNFNPKDFEYLKDKGVSLFLYKLANKDFAALPKETRYIVLGADKASVYALVADSEINGEAPFALPEQSPKEIDGSLAEIRDELAEIERQLSSLSGRKAVIEKEEKTLLKQIEFETARAGMDVLADAPPESTVAWITGFVPQEDLGLLKRGASENGWALMADDPGPDDFVPTKLKNNKLVSLIYPLTDFLEVTPGYNEVDISGWFLLFFTVFFGMIFGDAGYGAIVLIAAIAGILKTAKKGVPPVLKLLLLLGLSNFVWGVLTCTWFALDVAVLPSFLKSISLPLISNVTSGRSAQDSQIVQQNLMIFCFSLALLQLSIGHIVAIFKGRNLKSLGDIGSMAMLVGMYFIVLSLIASNAARQIPMFMWAVYVFFAGFILNFVFANYDGSIGRSILESCKNIISVILGIANVFSDIMSYIRLWAVGLAGAAIASTVNAMAGPMLGHLILFIFGIALLVFGHGLNLVLNVLSVLVHAVRLNTLEFSGHAGLTWSGTAYKPFSEKGKK
ncbi:V-type ATP synthase subunit I [Leadbettera azotonutricia]|uniref:V-type ATP synthase subunit I 1 (V-type ATPase subunit I1) n=1 Tax=Leadbettera azotonutricia (strain ATCC BAA-888 / DSM 13862 / ZAS-9) TaxID=545695 RepID=F5YFH4_LEAAZ|nr:ATP synthase subunit I [Leadbettera azotonutricia]AEF81733.1 V-type ATP synthase subunit I 1 (V-type ATPase subunit I1) [Leadbettera azotonutricia ZAS-9]